MNNMVMLGALGWNLEKEIGSFKFLLIYFVSGIGANLISLAMDFYTGNLAVSAGASGAIFGLLGALLWVVIRNRGKAGRLTGRGMLFMVLLSLYFWLYQYRRRQCGPCGRADLWISDSRAFVSRKERA